MTNYEFATGNIIKKKINQYSYQRKRKTETTFTDLSRGSAE